MAYPREISPREFDRLVDGLRFKVRVIDENRFAGFARGKQVEEPGDRRPRLYGFPVRIAGSVVIREKGRAGTLAW
jgi:hypothetical protein